MPHQKVVPFPRDTSLHLTIEIMPAQTLITTPLGSLSLEPNEILVTIPGYEDPVTMADLMLNWQVTDGAQK